METKKIEIVKDEIAEALDELADLCEYWKKNRERGRMPNGVRAGIVTIVNEISFIKHQEEYRYARTLAESIWKNHYQKESPNWKPFDELMGVLSQIDNMTCGLIKKRS